MDYAKVIRLPQYFRNLQRLGEITTVLARHGFGDLLARLHLTSFIESGLRLLRPGGMQTDRSPLSPGSRLRMVCEELGPTFIKFAQLVAARPDVFPDWLVSELRKLQDKVPPFSSEDAKEVIREELGNTVEALFDSFEETPLGSASIAQVHRARLKDGRKVVIKVQRPRLQKVIDTDTDILRGLAALVEENLPETRMYSLPRVVEEFARSLKGECDFGREALSMRRFARFFHDEPGLIVPHVYAEFSSDRVLTEEYIEGIKADEIEALKLAGIDTRTVAEILNRVVLRSIFEDRFFHADPHPGNILITTDSRVALIDFGAMGRLDTSRFSFVLRFLVSILSKDVDEVLAVLHETEVAPRFIDEIYLKNQIAELLDTYLGQTLGSLDLSRLLADVFEVAKSHGIKPPPDLLLVGKSITTIEHLGALLDPEFDPLKAVRPYLLSQYARELLNPVSHGKTAWKLAEGYSRLITELPGELRYFLRSLTRGSLSFNAINPDIEDQRAHQNSLVNRSIVALMGLSFLILGVTGLQQDGHGLNYSLWWVLMAIGALLLGSVWLAIRRSGGIR